MHRLLVIVLPYRLRARLLFALLMLATTANASAAPTDPAYLNLSSASGQVAIAPYLSFIEDASNRLTIGQLDSAEFAHRYQPATQGLGDANFSYSASTFWLRFSVHADADTPAPWLLEVGFPSLDEVEFFWRTPEGAFASYRAGDLLPFSARVFPHRHFVFPINMQTGGQTFYVKVRSKGSLTVPVTLWQPSALQVRDQDNYASLSIYYGVVVGLVCFNLLLFFAIGDRIFLFYTCFGVWMAISQASLDGLSNQYLWPDFPRWGNIALPTGMAFTGVFGTLFIRRFLNTRVQLPRLDQWLRLLVLAFALLVLSFVLCAWAPEFISYRIAGMLMLLVGAVAACSAFAIGLYAWRHELPGAKLFLIAWTMLLIGVVVVAMRFVGWMPTTVLTTHAMQIGSAMEMVLLSLALADRINSVRRAKEASDQIALKAQQDLVDALRQNEVELEANVARRTNELLRTQQHLVLQEKMAGLGTLTAGVAHEINNPTNFVHVAAQNLSVDLAEFEAFLKELVDTDEAPEVLDAFSLRFNKLSGHVKTMLHGTERIKTIVKDLRAFTRSDRAEKTRARMSECLLSTLHLVRSSWQEKVEFTTEFIDDPEIACWPALLNQVFMNLLVNGSQAIAARTTQKSAEIGRITITMQIKEAELHIDFSDNGVGMTAPVQARVLEPFFTTKDVGDGTGLGLSISYGIILQHDGKLQIDSTPAQGSCFTVILPVLGNG
jgi:signal transduction histidine kinase